MRVDSITEEENAWVLGGPCGEHLRLAKFEGRSIDIGLLGTRTSLVRSGKTNAMIDCLARLQKPVMMLDVRRNGSGGSGSWGPREFGTIIPNALSTLYSYHHLPQLAPSTELLSDYRKAMKLPETLDSLEIKGTTERIQHGTPGFGDVVSYAWKHWQVFRARYLSELSDIALRTGRAFIEAANAIGGLPIFLCAEECCPDFESESQAVQDEHYCHRYTLCSVLANHMQAARPGTGVRFLSLRIGAGCREESRDKVAGGNYRPLLVLQCSPSFF